MTWAVALVVWTLAVVAVFWYAVARLRLTVADWFERRHGVDSANALGDWEQAVVRTLERRFL